MVPFRSLEEGALGPKTYISTSGNNTYHTCQPGPSCPGPMHPLEEMNITGERSDVTLDARFIAMFAIFVISLFAVSLPALSRQKLYLRLPRLVFFIGKHFGTGVILSTAFGHLLQDAFKALHDPAVRARWDVEHFVGLIILGSLLSIFLVEYFSTSYVDRLQAKPSSPPLSASPPTPSNHSTHSQPPTCDTHIHENAQSLGKTPEVRINFCTDTSKRDVTERSPLLPPLPSACSSYSRARSKSFSYGSYAERGMECEGLFFEGHHRHETRKLHCTHHARTPKAEAALYPPSDAEQGDEVVLGFQDAYQKPLEEDHGHSHGAQVIGHAGDEQDREGNPDEDVQMGANRQIVGILVLQLGIMIHSFVIGLTLSIVTSEFASLVTAIMFHQLFEGLSLGIRIASLSASRDGGFKRLPFLEQTLSVLFAITTPVGIAIGLLLFTKGTDSARMKLTQGVMSALSAGMLIYAACVEMLAGDFIMDPLLWRSSLWKQALALGSLFAGVAVMALIG